MTKRYWHDLIDGTLVENIPLAELTTDPATSITADAATLGGSVDTLEGNTGQLDYFFEWGEVGAGFPNSTIQSSTSTAPIAYTNDISGLSQKTDYEFRAAGTVDGETFTGGTQTFTTPIAIPDSGVSRWEFEQNVADSWGSNDGTLSGASFVSDSVEGTYALQLDGVDDYVEYPAVDYGTNFTISIWFKTTNEFQQRLINADDLDNPGPDGERNVLSLRTENGGVVTFSIDDGSGSYPGVSSPGTYADGTYHHAVGVLRSGGTLEVWVDGQERASTSVTQSNGIAPDTPGYIGNWIPGDGSNSGPFEGVLDDARIYSKSLSSTEISNLYNTGSI